MNARLRIIGLALAALTLGCHHQSTTPPTLDPIVQTLRIEPPEPREGETITVYSTIENRGPRTERVTYRICILGMGGDLALTMVPGTVRCAAVSATGDLAPGQRVEAGDARVVASQAGDYTLAVSHLLDPLRTATISVHVRN